MPRRAIVLEPQRLFLSFICDAVEAGGAHVVLPMTTIDRKLIADLEPDLVYVDLDWLSAGPHVALGTLRHLAPTARIIAQSSFTSEQLLREGGADRVVGADATDVELRAMVWQLLYSGKLSSDGPI
ncbi:MAG: hypothetical protein ACREM6_13035 [Vulcanimicrobiaceae bacterium]